MNGLLLFLFVAAVVILLLAAWLKKRGSKPAPQLRLPASEISLLTEYVPFYRQLDPQQKKEFESRVQHFLNTTKITGIKTTVEEMDRLFIAASAIIPIFYFKDWEYVNLREVLLYPDSFSETFEQEGKERPILGMVGSGALNNLMILSRHELRQAFLSTTGKTNTAIHEFVHLVDKTDGTTDGIPGFILDKKYILPWLQLMHREIQKIRDNHSDINPYGATNQAEFFAVVAEYFFERPDLLKQKHPELYTLLSVIFRQKPLS